MKLPENFESYFLERWHPETLSQLVRGLDSEPSVSIRLNVKRMNRGAEPHGADGHVPWCPEGIYLRHRPVFTADPLLHAGAYYVQEASSMFLAHVFRTVVPPPIGAALDLCAAPGGKSTLLRSLLPDGCLLVANEPHRGRCQVLAENLAKWGSADVLVTQASAADFGRETGSFGLILADVPCSGEGMMRREEEARRQWSPGLVASCAALSRSIVADVWSALQPGGTLVYSTCTFNPEEDEQNVEWIAQELGADIVAIPVRPEWGILGDLRRGSSPQAGGSGAALPVCHFLPGRVRGEGFFIAVLRKHGSPEAGASPAKPGKKGNRRGKTLRQRLTDALTTLPTGQLEAPEAPRVELSLDEAMRYLRREVLHLAPDVPRGIVQVCHQGQRLGLANNLGSRANNLYPKEWRIRSSFVAGHSLFGNGPADV